MVEQWQHDVKPRVVRHDFSTRFGDASAQTQKLSMSDTVREKHCLNPGWPEINTGNSG
jgi:hypothetical protein